MFEKDAQHGLFSAEELYLGYGLVKVEGFSYSHMPKRLGSVTFSTDDNDSFIRLEFKDEASVDKLIDFLIDFKDKSKLEIDWTKEATTSRLSIYESDMTL